MQSLEVQQSYSTIERYSATKITSLLITGTLSPSSVRLAPLQASATSLRVIDVSAEAVDAAVAAIQSDRRVAEAFLREPWPPLADFLQRGGTSTLLEFIQHTPGER